MKMDINVLLEDKVFVYDRHKLQEIINGGKDMHFIIIGAGGTGGYLIPNLGRMIGIKNKEGYNHSVTIIDKDDVEEKNLLRQNFSPNDIGKNKAEVMATRYGRAFGETFYYLDEYIETAEQVKDLLKEDKKTAVIIDCVDNNKTRFILKQGIRDYHNHTSHEGNDTIYISSGNEKYGGQVVFSYKLGYSADLYNEYFDYKTKSPDLIDIFPNMEIGLLPEEESCAERAVSAPQNIATNITAADIIFGFTNKLLNDLPVDIMAVFFDSQTMLRKTYSGRETHVRELLKKVENNSHITNFIEGERYDLNNSVAAPSYETVINQHLVDKQEAIDAILEKAKEDSDDLVEQINNGDEGIVIPPEEALPVSEEPVQQTMDYDRPTGSDMLRDILSPGEREPREEGEISLDESERLRQRS